MHVILSFEIHNGAFVHVVKGCWSYKVLECVNISTDLASLILSLKAQICTRHFKFILVGNTLA